MKRSILALTLLTCFTITQAASVESPKRPAVNYPLMTGNEKVSAPVAFPPYMKLPPVGNLDVIGDTVTIGTTWYEYQHNGTIGRMLEKSDDGYLHFVWMNGLDYGGTYRHVYYNYIDPTGNQGWPGVGYPVEVSDRAGYTTLDVDFNGIAFPAFHWRNWVGDDFWTAVATDFFPHSGTFLVYVAPQVPGVPEVIWPRMQFDRNQVMHIVSTENPEFGSITVPHRHYYYRATYDPAWFSITYDTAEEMTWTMTLAADVATSDVSDRIAFGWTYCRDEGFPEPGGDYSQMNNDIYVLIDEDGIDPDWNECINLTNFIPPEWG